MERRIQDMKAEVEGLSRQNKHFLNLYRQCLVELRSEGPLPDEITIDSRLQEKVKKLEKQ